MACKRGSERDRSKCRRQSVLAHGTLRDTNWRYFEMADFESGDETLGTRARQFGDLLAECHGDLFGFIFSLVQHRDDAEDVYQQVAMVLWKEFDNFELGTNFAAWATAVAHNVARAFIRNRRRKAITFSDDVLDAIAAAYNEKRSWPSSDTADALNECIEKLSQKDRSLVERCYSEDRDFAAIAAEDNRSIGAIYQAISRIRKNLYSCVKRTLSRECV